MEAHKVTILIVDFERIGIEGVKEEIENANFGNDCISPQVIDIETRDIGEWRDDHPLNSRELCSEEFNRLFDDIEKMDGLSAGCFDAIAKKIEACGIDMSATPPMFYPEAIHNVVVRAVKTCAKIVKEKHGVDVWETLEKEFPEEFHSNS